MFNRFRGHRIGRRPVVATAGVAAVALVLAACGPTPVYSDNGTIVTYAAPTAASSPSAIILGPDGNMWFIETASIIARVTPAGVITEFPTPTGGRPTDIVTGPDNRLWFTEANTSKLAAMTTAGVVTEYAVPTAGSSPSGITVGPDGHLWYTEQSGERIGEMSTTGSGSDYPITTATGQPMDIVTGSDGKLWFTESNADKVGSITTSGVVGPEISLTAGSHPLGIASGPDGNLWVAESGLGTSGVPGIARVATTGGTFTEFPVPGGTNSLPVDIVPGPDGNLWYTQYGGNVGRVTLAGVTTQFPIPVPAGSGSTSYPQQIGAGVSNALWFTELRTVSSTTTGAVAQFDPVPVIASVSPGSGAAAGGNSDVLSCTGCRGATTVHFGSTVLTPCSGTASPACFTLDPVAGTITLTVPAGTAGTTVPVTVTTPYATSVAAAYSYAAVVIPGVTPPVPASGGGFSG